MHPTRIYAVFIRQMYVIRNLPSRVVPYLVYAALDIVLWGFITKYLDGIGAGFHIVSALLGAVLLWDFLQRVQQGITIPFLEDVWTKNLLNTFASPLKLHEYLAGFILTSIATSSLGLVVMIVLAYFLFGLSLLSIGFAIFPFALLLFFFGIVLGIFASSVVLRFGPYAEWFIWPIPSLLSPFVGVFYPIATLPEWMQYVSFLLPPSYVFEGMRSILVGGAFNPELLLVGFAITFGYLCAAYGLFVFTYRVVVRRGLIARFSVEGA